MLDLYQQIINVMSLIPAVMAPIIQASVAGLTGGDLVAKFWQEACNYISQNALVTYAWAGVSPVGVPDPIVVQTGKLVATPHGGVTKNALLIPDPTIPGAADMVMALLGTLMTADQMGWVVTWNDPTFITVPPTIIIPGVINLSPIGVPDTTLAFLDICTNICSGLWQAKCLPATAGTHTVFTGTATFVAIA